MPDNVERYFIEVVIVLDALDDEQTKRVVKELESRGLRVDSVDNDNSVVEGTIEAARLHDIQSVPSVRYVRKEFSYLAEFPKERQSGQKGTNPPPVS